MLNINRIVGVSFLVLAVGCTTVPKAEKEPAEVKQDTAVVVTKKPDSLNAPEPLVMDYVVRVRAFKKMPDATTEQQIAKYETFANLYIEYAEIFKNENAYPAIERGNNHEAFNVLRDETISLKLKLKKNIATMTKEQEDRLDQADLKVNNAVVQ